MGIRERVLGLGMYRRFQRHLDELAQVSGKRVPIQGGHPGMAPGRHLWCPVGDGLGAHRQDAGFNATRSSMTVSEQRPEAKPVQFADEGEFGPIQQWMLSAPVLDSGR